MESTSEVTSKSNTKRSKWLAIWGLLISVLVGSGVYEFYHRADSYPPGWQDSFDNRDWDRNAISHFLDIPIPDEAQDLVIDGQQGIVGSYGIYPKLSFSFNARPESALQFVAHFCYGELHIGYDPRHAVDLSEPVDNAVLIRGNRTIYYSYSEGTPQTIHGNRCARYDDRDPARLWIWIEEVTLDTSDPDEYRVSYHLPFDANSASAEGYYPRAQTVAPFGDQFRFNITGFTEDYALNYHTICMETTALALVWDHFAFNSDVMPVYAGSEVTIFINGVQQPTARISESGLSLRPLDGAVPPDAWQYCLNADWETGIHAMQVVVEPLVGEPLVLNWEFTVPN